MHITSYLDRYRNGEQTEVWAEMVAFGPAVRQEPLYSEAVVVAREIMTRARHNVALLVERLQVLAFQFTYPDMVWVPPTDDLMIAIQEVERLYGPLPLMLRMWFEVVGQVNFMGVHPRLSHYHGLVAPDQQGPPSDPLQVEFYGVSIEEGLDQGIHISTTYDLEDSQVDPDDPNASELLGPGFDFSIDASHKANHSGSGMIRVPLVSDFDARVYTSDVWTKQYFVPYLRNSFAWGGFPELENNPPGAAPPQTELDFLTKDLLPL
jgi:hypothetical protein